MKLPTGAPSRDAAGDLSLGLLNAALDSMPYGFSIWDDSLRLVLINQRYLDIYRFPPDKVRTGMSLKALVQISVATGNHPGKSASELYPTYRDRLLRTTDPERPLVIEKTVHDRGIRTTHYRRPGLGWVNLHEDITEQKHREDTLHQQTLRLDAALDSMPYGFCLWDSDLRLVVYNSKLVELFGLDAATDWIGASLLDVLAASTEAGNHQGRTAGEVFAIYREQFARLGADETFTTEEVLGSGRVVKVSFRRTPDGSLVATYEDITEQKDQMQALRQREAELARQNMRFEAAVDNMSQGLCMFDSERRLIISNRRFADLYGTPANLLKPGTSLEEILHDRIARGFHPREGAEAYIRSRIGLVEARVDAVDVVELQDGRVISVLHHPMPDGGWVSTHQDITEQRQAEARIRHLARHDALTGLPNRMEFRERLAEAEAAVHREQSFALHFIDLDHYKTINDLFGHAVGDAVLVRVAARLVKACRKGDTVARLGGDEFAILQTRIKASNDAARLADRVVRTMSDPMTVEGHEVVIGASVGIAIAPDDGQGTETLMKNADLALYRAKAEGRGAYHFFEAEMDAVLQERIALETELRTATAAGELSLLFQPLFDLDRNRICGVEALLRWNHPTRGMLTPADILPIAEETGLVVPIGEWVLHQACAEATRWPDHVHVAVNLSPVQFRRRNLIDQVKSALAGAGLRPGRLELDITELALLADNAMTLEILHQLHGLGVRIALDDFGTGYSSLSYLRSFPFHKVKIDRTFVRDIATRPDSIAIIRGVIDLGRSLGMSTAAEGVETEEQLAVVREQGCSEVQGYLFSPPLPAGAITALFAGTDSEARLPRVAAS